MKKSDLTPLLAVATLFLATSAFAQPADRPDEAGPRGPHLKKLALNHDGKIDETERAAADLINVPVEVRKLTDVVYQARGVGNTNVVATSEEAELHFTPQQMGDYQVVLHVTDDDGGTTMVETTISVRFRPGDVNGDDRVDIEDLNDQ